MPNTAEIRKLNDAFRSSFRGGKIVLTRSIAGHTLLDDILERVRTFDNFNERNDPHCEHDFGSLDIEGDTVFWKIDVYDRDLQFGSPDPADPKVSLRVITLMLSQEY